MTQRKLLKTRRERNLELGAQDSASCCQHCKNVLESVRIAMGERFCSTECEDDHLAFLARWEAARAKVGR